MLYYYYWFSCHNGDKHTNPHTNIDYTVVYCSVPSNAVEGHVTGSLSAPTHARSVIWQPCPVRRRNVRTTPSATSGGQATGPRWVLHFLFTVCHGSHPGPQQLIHSRSATMVHSLRQRLWASDWGCGGGGHWELNGFVHFGELYCAVSIYTIWMSLWIKASAKLTKCNVKCNVHWLLAIVWKAEVVFRWQHCFYLDFITHSAI